MCNIIITLKEYKVFIYRFFKENNIAFKDFEYEIRMQNGGDFPYKSFNDLIEFCYYSNLHQDLIDRAFMWHETKKGFDYYEELDEKFRSQCQKYINFKKND